MDELPPLEDVKMLARWLDNSIPLPLGARIGWDGIFGLVPVVGNLATTCASLYIVARAAALDCSNWVLFRMGLNIVVDNLFDGVPLLGTLFDFAWKSNVMNVRLLEAYLQNPRRMRRRSKWGLLVVAAVIGIGLLATAALTVWLSLELLRWVLPKVA